MKIIQVEQGSGDWFYARLGIPTASCFHQIVTPVKCELSKQSVAYAYRLVAERLLQAPGETVEGVQWMERGKEMEPLAVRQYEFVQDVETEAVGFITTDDGRLGASPDRLVRGRAIGVEVKCPAPHTHLGYLLDGHNEAYRPQVQGQLYVAELERVDFYAYHPRMPACLIETPRDEAYIAKLAAALAEFGDMLERMTERARSLGLFQPYERVLTPAEKADAERADAEFQTATWLKEA